MPRLGAQQRLERAAAFLQELFNDRAVEAVQVDDSRLRLLHKIDERVDGKGVVLRGKRAALPPP